MPSDQQIQDRLDDAIYAAIKGGWSEKDIRDEFEHILKAAKEFGDL